jgi:hypothetical protein
MTIDDLVKQIEAQSAGNVLKRRRSGRLLSRLHDTRLNQALGICT